MIAVRLAVTGLVIIAAFLMQNAIPVYGDIYSYTDGNGVVHFSNTPTSPLYRLKIKENHFDYKKLASGNYDTIINAVCLKHQIDPLLVKAIIKAESDFNPLAVSEDGAVGLMQLMPKTADDMGVNDAFDPKDNIEGGVKHLKHLMARFNSNLKLVVAAYNAGEKAVQKYNNSVPPFKETRQYVKRVLSYLKSYKMNS